MLDKSVTIIAALRLYNADDNHRTAQHNLAGGYYNAANDRAFFCMYHAARALLAYDGVTQTSTNIVMKSFCDLYIRQRYHDPRLGKMFEAALKVRMDGIYDDGFVATKEESERHVENAGYFLELSRVILNRRKTIEYDQQDSDAESGNGG